MSVKGNKKKTEQLGMPVGTANNRLKKQVMFSLLVKLGENYCFQCSAEIESVEDLSLEHKVAWLDNSVELFWDIDNIAFSHLSCNVGAGRRRKAPHGTETRYKKGCRCKECTRANTVMVRGSRKRRKEREEV